MPHHRRVRALALVSLCIASVAVWGCKSTVPPAPVVVVPPVISPDRKMSWILRVEQQRMLRDADAAPLVAPVADAPAPRTFSSATAAGLDGLALDSDPSVRRRAVLAIGRIGM